MVNRKIIMLLLLCQAINSYSQVDTVICLNINDSLSNFKRSNVVSIDLIKTIYPIFYGGLGGGLSYERLLTSNQSLYAYTSYWYGQSYYNANESKDMHYLYASLGYRFYFYNTTLSKLEISNEKYIVRKQVRKLNCPQGFFISIIISLNREYSEEDFVVSNPATNYFPYFYHYDYGMGGCFGYQFVFFNRLSLSAAIPTMIGVHQTFDKDYDGTKYNIDNYFQIEPSFYLTAGFAF